MEDRPDQFEHHEREVASASTGQGTVVRFASDSELIVEAPGGKPDETVDVVLLLEPGGEITLSHAFTFVAHP